MWCNCLTGPYMVIISYITCKENKICKIHYNVFKQNRYNMPIIIVFSISRNRFWPSEISVRLYNVIPIYRLFLWISTDIHSMLICWMGNEFVRLTSKRRYSHYEYPNSFKFTVYSNLHFVYTRYYTIYI